MRLLLFTNVFPNPCQPTKGVFNLELARTLARSHDLCVVSPIAWVDEWRAAGQTPGRGPQRHQTVDGVEVHYPRFYYPPKVLRRFYGWFLWRSVRGTVRRMLRSHAPEAVIGYWAHPDGAVAVRIAREMGVPAVVMVGGSDVALLARHGGRRRCIQRALRAADAVVTVSRDLKAKVTDLGVGPDKVHVVYRGISNDLFAPGDRLDARRRLGIPAGTSVLLWVGRMVPVKGLDVLLEACATLRGRGVDFRLCLVGDGPLRRSLESASHDRGLADVVSFVGPQPHDMLPDWYQAADLTVLPSRSEGVPNVLRESLACGTPVVASHVGGVAEVASGGSSQLVPPGDATALAEAIGRALAGPRPIVRAAAGSAGWEESAESLMRVIRSLVPSSPNEEAPRWACRTG
jgi:glycosyltransferase involved in cell wall biosynthesis